MGKQNLKTVARKIQRILFKKCEKAAKQEIIILKVDTQSPLNEKQCLSRTMLFHVVPVRNRTKTILSKM